ncbi:hypothetical protein MM438_12750 [Arsenicicoccus dermatophilus]|nr:hypothetical protein [Arsenicicoccus dermatophilus]
MIPVGAGQLDLEPVDDAADAIQQVARQGVLGGDPQARGGHDDARRGAGESLGPGAGDPHHGGTVVRARRRGDRLGAQPVGEPGDEGRVRRGHRDRGDLAHGLEQPGQVGEERPVSRAAWKASASARETKSSRVLIATSFLGTAGWCFRGCGVTG